MDALSHASLSVTDAMPDEDAFHFTSLPLPVAPRTRRDDARLFLFAAIIALIVGASVGVYTATKVTNDVHRQVHNGLLYNCGKQQQGRVQGNVRAFVQRTFLSTDTAVRQRSAEADAVIESFLRRTQIPPAQKAQVVSAFDSLAQVNAEAAEYWTVSLAPLIEDLPAANCEEVFSTDTPPRVVVPAPPKLPMPPSLLVPK